MKRNSATRIPSSRTFFVLACGFAVALLGSERAFAHDLRAKVSPDSNPIRVEAWFDDDEPAAEARVVVNDTEGRTIASGVLDEKGVWSFPKPSPGSYLIVVELAGHRDRIRLEIPEAAAPEVAETWRLDKNLGLVIGLGLLLGGSLSFAWLRRSRRRGEVAPSAAPPPAS